MAFLARVLGSYRDGLAGVDRRVFLVATMTLLSVASRMSVYTFLGIYFTREVGLSLALVGAAYLLENVLRGLIAPLAGALSDRVGRAPVIAASALASAAVLPTFLLVDSPATLLAWGAALGLAQAGMWPATSALLMDFARPEQRQAVLGLNYTMLSIGYTLGVAPAGFLLTLGFPTLAAASAGGFVVIAATYALTMRKGLPRQARPQASFASDLARAPRDPSFVTLASLAIVFPLGIGLIAAVSPLYAKDAGLDETAIGLALAVNGPLLALFALPVSTWLTRYGPYRHLVLAAAFLAASYLSLIVSGGFTALVVASVVFTAGELIFSSALPAAVAGLAPPGLRGAYQGAWAMVHSVGFGAAVFLTGLAQPLFGWRTTWILWTALTALATLGLAMARPRFRRMADERADAGAGAQAGATSSPASSPTSDST